MEKRTLNNTFTEDFTHLESSTRPKRRRSSITNDSIDSELIAHSNVSSTRNRKRSAEDDLITYSTSSLFREFEPSVSPFVKSYQKISFLLFLRQQNEFDMTIQIIPN